MADAAARREARRKRILENSHNRLQLISGKTNDENCKESPSKPPVSQLYESTIITENNVASSFPLPLLNGIVEPEVELPQPLPSRRDVVAAGDGESVNNFTAFVPSQAPEQPQSPLWATLIAYKYDIVLLSLFLQLVHGLSIINFENSYFFLPLIIYTFTKVVYFPSQSNSSIANVLLLLNLHGMNPNRIKKILQIVQITSVLSQDIFIFLFTSICIQTLFTTLKDSFVT